MIVWNIHMDMLIRNSEKMFSDIFLPEEIKEIRNEARNFAEKYIKPKAHLLNNTVESKSSFPREVFDLMTEHGLYQIPFAQDVGGRGLKYPTLATLTVMEELAYYSAGATSALFDGQALLVGNTLDKASSYLREKYLSKLVKGTFVGAFATSEPLTSTDLSVRSMQSYAQKVEGGWIVNAHKRWITNSVVAEYILVLCATDHGLTMFFIDMDNKNIHVGDPDIKMGNKAQLTADVHINDVFILDSYVVGEVGKGLNVALAALTLGRMGIGAIGVGMAQSALDYAINYSKNRKVFGQALARFQHWQYTFSDHALNIENARNLYIKAAYRYDIEGNAEIEAAMSKIAGSQLAVEVSRDAIQVCGAYGFVQQLKETGGYYPLESIYRDAKIGEIYEGANEIQRWVIARNLFGRAFSG
ncbi:acyl-CoA dehydrogenase family protein [Acinetobacter guillouiae]|uniref:acyl-CoA dehydrogenase family protein n=2 Tax=Acinetobacter guillouiae TaxID=106649 RepID=UPI001FD8DEFD|nr:acyl-CoA dehydrogenase family protein [Acinetobacter guillouiae]MBP2543169.1 butyryl-CoA dehydrogenase [Acinetobacter guillouiae]